MKKEENKKALKNIRPHLPDRYGNWSGESGNSEWLFDLNALRWDFLDFTFKPWGDMLARTVTPGISCIPFQSGFPDFGDATVEVAHPGYQDLLAVYAFPPGQQMVLHRPANMNRADRWVADYFGCTVSSVVQLRREQHYTWHEEEDMRHMRLVVREVHNYVTHSGGISALLAGGPGKAPQDTAAARQVQLNGMTFQVCEGLWSIHLPRPDAKESSEEMEWIYVLDDLEAGPTQEQQELFAQMQEDWQNISAEAQKLLTAYVEAEYPDSEEWVAAPEQVIFYPDEDDVGILYSFSLDTDHGLGIRLCQGQIEAGSGDVAL